MKTIKIIVDELPSDCDECKFSHDWFDDVVSPSGIECEWTKTKVVWRVAINHRASDCPLQLDEVCEWVLDYHIDDAMWDIAPSCCIGEFSINKPNYETCPSCGKRINYVEVE